MVLAISSAFLIHASGILKVTWYVFSLGGLGIVCMSITLKSTVAHCATVRYTRDYCDRRMSGVSATE